MKITTPLLFLCISVSLNAQNISKIIKEKNVSRIITTMAADNMMGRSASRPEHIERAIVFIESELKKIGLKNLPELTTYRQEFNRDIIVPTNVEVVINGTRVTDSNVVVASESTLINFSQGLAIKSIDYNTSISNKRRHLLRNAFSLVEADTTSSIIIVSPELENEFKELNSFYSRHYVNNQKSTKLFVLGKFEIQNYSVKATQKIETITMANVVGILPGETKPDEFVVFSSHYDHLGIRPPVAGDSIANGADDDASGTTAVIALAKYFKKLKNNNRTLIFVAFTAEEIDGYGSQYFSKQVNADKVVAMFNIEMIGKPSKWGPNNAFITGYERSDFGPILQKNLTGTAFQFRPDPYTEQNLFYRSDNATLARLGVPAHSISTVEIDIDKFYHTVDDEVGTLSMSNLTSTIRAIALSSRSIVSGEDTPTRIDKSMVR